MTFSRLATLALAVVVALAGVGCRKKQSRVALDDTALQTRLEGPGAELLARPEVKTALASSIVAVLSDRTISPAADKLLERLTADKTLVNTATTLIGRLQQLPAYKALIKPGSDAHENSARAMQQLDGALHQPQVSAALEAFPAEVARQVLRGPALHGLAARFADAAKGRYEDHFAKRLAELNGGQPPTAEQAAALVGQHVLTTERLAALLQPVLASRVARTAVATLVARVLGEDRVGKAIHQAMIDLASDPTLQDDALALLDVLLSSQVDPVAIEARVRKVLSPRTVGAVARAVQAGMLAPAAREAADEALDAMAEDPAVASAVATFMTGW